MPPLVDHQTLIGFESYGKSDGDLAEIGGLTFGKSAEIASLRGTAPRQHAPDLRVPVGIGPRS